MRRVLKWIGAIVLVLGIVGFLVFLYVIPPVFLIAPETYGRHVAEAAPTTDRIADPAERAIAERGRRLVMNIGCIGCHAANGSRGPDYSRYLAGGGIKIVTHDGTYVSRNLTPDPETGLARRTDDDVKRVLRSGTFPDGHVVPHTAMPWTGFSQLTEEDRHAIIVYLRSIPDVRHPIPDPSLQAPALPAEVVEGLYGLRDYGIQ